MEKRTTVYEASQQFDEILREVADQENSYVLERSGEAVAAVVPIYVYENWQRQQGLPLLHQTQRNADMETDEAAAETEQPVAEDIEATFSQNELRRKREELFELIRRAQQNSILSDENEIQQIVDEAIREVRAEMRNERAMAALLTV